MHNSIGDSISISFHSLFRVIWKSFPLFFFIIVVSLGFGLWYCSTLQEEFLSEGKILPEVESQGGKLGGLAGLANLAGVDLSRMDGTEAIRPDLYPDILTSTPFFLELFKHKITTRDNKTLVFEEFYHQIIEKGNKIEDKRRKKFPVKENGFLLLDPLSEDRIKNLKGRINIVIDKKSGIIIISVKMPDPVVAASITRFSMIYLTDYVTRYRINKLKKNLDFLAERVNIARGNFYINQSRKAQYSDQFQLPTIRLQSEDMQRERIESEYRLSSTFYNELLKKYEEAKINLQRETPVFQVLEPPTVPSQKTEPKIALLLLVYVFLGGTIALLIILIKNKNYKQVFIN